MLLLLGMNHFYDEKMLDFDVFNECVTDRPTDRPTDTAYYRDARTHLKKESFIITETYENFSEKESLITGQQKYCFMF